MLPEPPFTPRREPVFNVPGVVVFLVAAFASIHAARAMMPEPASDWWTLALALIPIRFEGHAGELPGGAPAVWTSLVTHMFVHGDIVHLAVNAGAILAFGGAVAQRTGGLLFLAFSLVCGLAGAGLFVALNPGGTDPMIGASGAISGLCGATFRFMFAAMDTGGLWRLREEPREVPLMSLAQALSDRRVVVVSLTWIGINLLAIVGVGNLNTDGGVAWQAHIGGFVAGFLLFGLFDPIARAKDYRAAARRDAE